MSLSPAETIQYAGIIDGILAAGDLTTISAKQIRKGLQAAVDHDISDKKPAIQALIMERFDKASTMNGAPVPPVTVVPPPPPPPPTNGLHFKKEAKRESSERSRDTSAPTKAETEDSEDDISPSKKKRKQQKPVDDAKLAAILQAQENSKARPTRGGANKKVAAPRKKTPKKKSAAKVRVADDSDMELGSDGEVKVAVRKGGFHKQYHLSAPLADLVGEPTLSRPQVVKKIWAHIKKCDLQDPCDKRQIICDERMQLVFKQDKVHMFTMNKILGNQLYPVEE